MSGATAVALRPDEQGKAVAERTSTSGLLKPLVSPAQLMEVHESVRALVRDALKEGRDYGLIPGTDRKSLLKPGAERISTAFGTRVSYEIVASEVDHERVVEWVKKKKIWTGPRGNRRFDRIEEETGTSVGLYRYVIRCDLFSRDTGELIGSGSGSCSTLEAKYVDRPRESENTVLKMAQKRALVDAVNNTFGLSDMFGDLDESPDPSGDAGPSGQRRPPQGQAGPQQGGQQQGGGPRSKFFAVLGHQVPDAKEREAARKALVLAYAKESNYPDSMKDYTPEQFEVLSENLERLGSALIDRAISLQAEAQGEEGAAE